MENVEILAEGQNTHTMMFMNNEGKIYGVGYNGNGRMMSDRYSHTFVAWEIDSDYMNLSNNQEYIEVGDTLTLNASYYNGYNLKLKEKKITNLTFESSNPDILTVDENGTITAVARGTATVIATDTVTGDKAESIINVVNKGATAIPSVQSGNLFTVMLKEDGTVWTAGACTNGSLGTNYGKNQLEPAQVLDYNEKPLKDIRKISVGFNHVLALDKNGTVWAWGLGTSGQLGQNNKNTTWVAYPVLNEDASDVMTNVKDIAAGYDFSIIVTADKLAYGFGANGNYTYGTNNTTAYVLPTKVHYLTNVISASGGTDHVVYLKSDGTVWGTGLNTSGQLGDGTKVTKTEAVQATSPNWEGVLRDAVRVETGLNHTVVLKKDGTAVGFGINTYGQLGVSATPQPVPINLAYSDGTIIENITNIACNQHGTYIETENKETREIEVIAAGLNTSGELGINSKTTVKVFNVVKDTDGVSYLGNVASLGKAWLTHYGYAMGDGKVKITGLGTSGQHGNGWISNSIVPTEITGGELNVDKMYEINVGEKVTPKITVTPNFNLNLAKDEDFIPRSIKI